MTGLHGHQIRSFERDGFVSPVDVLSIAEASRYRDLLEQAERDWPGELDGENRNNAHLAFSFLDELAHHPKIVSAAQSLLGPDLLINATVLFIKEPQSEAFVSFHQDATYMGLSRNTGVSAWLALSPSNRTSGCMRMVPGSHKTGIQHHTDTVSDGNILTRGQTVRDVDESTVVDIELEPGQMSLHHVATLHDSRPNNSNDRRIGFVVQSFLPPNIRQLNGTMPVQLACGEDRYRNHHYVERCRSAIVEDGLELRNRANRLWSDILYTGTSRARRY